MLFFKSNKKATREELEHKARLQTANEFINVKDVRNSLLHTKDGFLFAYMKISPISLELLSPREKDKKIKNFAAEFSSEKKPLKFFSISRPVDISGMSAWLSSLLQEVTDPIRKELIIEEIREISSFALTGEVIERQFYLVLWEPQTEDGEKEIYRRANELTNKFTSCEITAELCGQETIVQLLNLFANPNYAHLEDGDVTPTIPMLKTSKRKGGNG